MIKHQYKSERSGGQVHEQRSNAVHNECSSSRDWREVADFLHFPMDKDEEAAPEVVERHAESSLQGIFYEGKLTIRGLDDSMAQADLDSVFGFEESWINGVGYADYGSCHWSQTEESEGVPESESNLSCDGACQYNLQVSDDRRRGREAFQGRNLRRVGHLDAERMRKDGDYSCKKLQASDLSRLCTVGFEVWRELDTTGVVKAAQRLGMTADPGPEIEGYEDKYFKDYQPNGEVIIVEYPDFAADLEE